MSCFRGPRSGARTLVEIPPSWWRMARICAKLKQDRVCRDSGNLASSIYGEFRRHWVEAFSSLMVFTRVCEARMVFHFVVVFLLAAHWEMQRWPVSSRPMLEHGQYFSLFHLEFTQTYKCGVACLGASDLAWFWQHFNNFGCVNASILFSERSRFRMIHFCVCETSVILIGHGRYYVVLWVFQCVFLI